MKNIKLAKELLKIAKKLLASQLDRNNEREIQKYFDDIESYLDDQLYPLGWTLYGYSTLIEEQINGKYVTIGRQIAVCPIQFENKEKKKIVDWKQVKRKLQGQIISIDSKDDVILIFNGKSGASGYNITAKFVK